jgi:hypothetical protein
LVFGLQGRPFFWGRRDFLRLSEASSTASRQLSRRRRRAVKIKPYLVSGVHYIRILISQQFSEDFGSPPRHGRSTIPPAPHAHAGDFESFGGRRVAAIKGSFKREIVRPGAVAVQTVILLQFPIFFAW